jgi:hypothetical protein
LQIWPFFGDNSSFYWANLQADSTIDAGSKVNPVPVSSFGIFPRTFVNAGNWASIDAIGDSFAGVGNNCMWHCSLSSQYWQIGVSSLAIIYSSLLPDR